MFYVSNGLPSHEGSGLKYGFLRIPFVGEQSPFV